MLRHVRTFGALRMRSEAGADEEALMTGHCKVIEDMLNEVVLETQREIALKLIINTKLSLEDIAEITELSVIDVGNIAIEQCHRL